MRFLHLALLAASLGMPTNAEARDIKIVDSKRAELPSGLVLESRGAHELFVRRGTQQVRLLVEERRAKGRCPDETRPRRGFCGLISLNKVVLEDSGDLRIDAGTLRYQAPEQELVGWLRYRPHELEALLDVADAAQQPRAAAITTLQRALTLDDRSWAAAQALARLQLAEGHPDEAVATLLPSWKRDPIGVHDQVARDRALRALLENPALVALRSPHPGTLRLAKIPTAGAFSATANAVVIAVTRTVNEATDSRADPEFTYPRLILFQALDAQEPSLALAPAEAARIDRLLRDFAFQPAAKAETAGEGESSYDKDPNRERATYLVFEKAGLRLELDNRQEDHATHKLSRKDPSVRVYRGDKLVTRSKCQIAELFSAIYLSDPGVLILVHHEAHEVSTDTICAFRVPPL